MLTPARNGSVLEAGRVTVTESLDLNTTCLRERGGTDGVLRIIEIAELVEGREPRRRKEFSPRIEEDAAKGFRAVHEGHVIGYYEAQ